MNAAIEAFCEKQMLPKNMRLNLLLVVEELRELWKPRAGEPPLDVTVAYSERTETLEVICERAGAWPHPIERDDLPDDFAQTIIRNLADTIEYAVADGNSRLMVRLGKG
jgi:polar amino acid transport system ATP-binding protein